MNGKAIAAIAITLIVAFPIGMGYVMNLDDVQEQYYLEGQSNNVSALINNTTQEVYTTYTGVNNNDYGMNGYYQNLNFVKKGSTYTSVPVYKYDHAYGWAVSNGYNAVPAALGNVWGLSSTDHYISGYSYVDSSGATVTGIITESAPNVTVVVQKTIDFYSVGEYKIPAEGVTDFKVRVKNSPGSLPTSVFVFDSYAHTNMGWHTPTSPGLSQPDTHYWYNDQTNQEILFTINLAEVSKTNIYPAASFITSGHSKIYLEKEASGNVYIATFDSSGNIVNSGSLGSYQYVRLKINLESVTLSGISGWPSVNAATQVFNEVTLPYTPPSAAVNYGGYTKVGFEEYSINTMKNIYRVDYTYIKSGTYPAASNATIDPAAINPQLINCQTVISQIGIYGSSITFAGNTYSINSDGNIVIGSHQTKAEGAVLRSTTEDGVTWKNEINGIDVGDTAAISTIGLNGTWSAIYNIVELNEESRTVTKWIAGHSAFDLDDYAMFGLITSVAATIALGLYGARSGVKVLWLMLATGGAAMVFLFML